MVFTQLSVVFEYFMMQSTNPSDILRTASCPQLVQIDFVKCLVNLDTPNIGSSSLCMNRDLLLK